MQNVRRQGFIIRKAANQNPLNIDTHQQRRYMSQTQFYRKLTPISNLNNNVNNFATSRRINRSPGHIIHMQLKKSRFNDRDLQLSNNGYGFDDDQNIDHNPQSYGTQLKYQYLESPTDLRQIGDNQQISKIHDKSFEQIQLPTGLAANTNLRIPQNIKLYEILQKLHYSLQHKSQSQTHQILQYIQSYLQYLQKDDHLNNINNLPLPLMRRKLLKQSLTIQRYSIVMVGLITAITTKDNNNNKDKDKMEDYKAYIINLVAYALDNLLLRLAILTEGGDKEVVQLLKEHKKEKLLNKGYETVKNNNQIMQETIIKLASIQKAFYDVYKKMYKQNKALDIKSQLFTFRQFIAYYLCESQRSELSPYLSLCPAPYLPSQQLPRYTLVIDVISVFLPYNLSNNSRLSGNKSMAALGGSGFRPFAQYFLDQMSQYFELVSYCDTMPEDANRVISLLDRKKHIKYRLFRHHVNKMKGINGKDLTRLGRDIDKIVVIDTSKDVQDLNTIVVSPWKGKKNNAELAQLCSILAMIAVKKLNPQKSIKKLQEKNQQNIKIGLKHINCGINLQ